MTAAKSVPCSNKIGSPCAKTYKIGPKKKKKKKVPNFFAKVFLFPKMKIQF
jgi:hypothetical protein